MSMIHDALKSMDAPPSVSTMRPTAAVTPRPAWIGGVVAFASVLGAAGVGWMWWQNQTAISSLNSQTLPSAAVVAPAPIPAPGPAATTLQPAVVPTEPIANTTAAAALPPPSTGTPALPTSVTATAGAEALTKSTPTLPASAPMPIASMASEHKAATQQLLSATTPKPARNTPPVATTTALNTDETPVELRFARFVSAMKGGQQADAERELAALKKHLPAEALGLVRAQAWFDLQAGRDVAAAAGYRSILERIPGDEEAAINLATIQLRQQQPEEARATLDTAIRLQPDSAALRNALGHFTPDTHHGK